MDLELLLNCPLCAAALLLVGILGPKVKDKVGPLLSKLLGLLKRPTEPVPGPSAPEAPILPNRPVIDRLLQIMLRLAKAKFPFLSEADALERLAHEQQGTAFYYEEEQRKEQGAKS